MYVGFQYHSKCAFLHPVEYHPFDEKMCPMLGGYVKWGRLIYIYIYIFKYMIKFVPTLNHLTSALGDECTTQMTSVSSPSWVWMNVSSCSISGWSVNECDHFYCGIYYITEISNDID